MPFNGTGLFVRLRNWVADATAGVKIRADYHDIEDNGFADGLSQCIARDGQSVIINNIPMNGKRLTALQDPVDPQDAATKAYADLKFPITGGTITGNLAVTGSIQAIGYQCRAGAPGPFTGSVFNFRWTGYVEAWIDNTNVGNLATTAYVEQRSQDWGHYFSDPKVNRSGDTITGGLTVNGELVAATNYIRFVSSGGPGYLQWNGGGNYGLGGGGTIWHNGNLNPIVNGRLAMAGDALAPPDGTTYEPFGGAVVTGVIRISETATGHPLVGGRWRYMQLLTPGGWFTVGYA